jgi:LPS-assembly lipoprotein
MQTRRAILTASALLLAGCGYRPLYGGGESSGAALGLSQVAVQEQKNRAGQLLRNELLSARLGSDPGTTTYTLAMDVTETGKANAGSNERVSYRMTAAYRLIDNASGKQVDQGKSFSMVSFDTVSEPLADLQAENNARQRAARELGQDIKTRLAARFAR